MPNPETPDYYAEVSASIKSIFDLTSRIDERMKIVMKKQEEMERKLDERLESIHQLQGRMNLLESAKEDLEKGVGSLQSVVHSIELNLQEVKIQSDGQESKWKTIVSFGVQIAWVILAAYLLMKLGIQAPAVP